MSMSQDQHLVSSVGVGAAAPAPRLSEDTFWEILLGSPGREATSAEEQGQPESAAEARNPLLGGVVIGKLVGYTDQGEPLVGFPAIASGLPRPARTIVVCGAADVGRDVVLQFEQGEADRPIIMGILQPPQPQLAVPATVQAKVDGENLVLSADREIVLRCGKASITLTRAGKIILRGAYLLSRSSGVNRIKGGSVQIN